jgi:hypothetical protein
VIHGIPDIDTPYHPALENEEDRREGSDDEQLGMNTIQ